ncbi:MAG: SH3 domain-containing protein [Nitrospirota bacterium]|jgi:SH3-like domain-containing protein
MKIMRRFIIPAAILFSFILPGSASALCVKAPEANLRQGPSTSYEKLWEVFKYMPFKQLDKRGLWYRVQDVDGDIYWIYAALVTHDYRCAVVKEEKANIRTGPGTNHEQTASSPALKYYSFKVLKVDGQWVHVEDEYGDRGWIYRPLLWIQ